MGSSCLVRGGPGAEKSVFQRGTGSGSAWFQASIGRLKRFSVRKCDIRQAPLARTKSTVSRAALRCEPPLAKVEASSAYLRDALARAKADGETA